jgi:LAGLIDADG DNA endonuclease family
MFVGWEGMLLCPKWLNIIYINILNIVTLSKIYCINEVIALKAALSNLDGEGDYKVACEAPALQGSWKNLDKKAISLIIGSLLGFSYMEKHGLGFRIVFIKLSNNVEYLSKFYSFFAKNGYCSLKKPVLYKFISIGNKVLFLYRFKTYTFSNFDWLFNMFYKNNAPNQGLHKIIPHNLNNYFTPLALATIFISISQLRLSLKTKDDGLACEAVALFINYKNEDLPKKFKLETIASIDDLKYLSFLLKNKYNIDTVIKFSGRLRSGARENANNFKGSLYIKNSSISSFSKLVKPHFLYSQWGLLKNLESTGTSKRFFTLWSLPSSGAYLGNKYGMLAQGNKFFNTDSRQWTTLVNSQDRYFIDPKFIYKFRGACGSWFRGFVDGDSRRHPGGGWTFIICIMKGTKIRWGYRPSGCFFINKSANWFIFRFQIGLHRDDSGVLYFIQKKLGIGKIVINNNAVIFTVAAKKEFLSESKFQLSNSATNSKNTLRYVRNGGDKVEIVKVQSNLHKKPSNISKFPLGCESKDSRTFPKKGRRYYSILIDKDGLKKEGIPIDHDFEKYKVLIPFHSGCGSNKTILPPIYFTETLFNSLYKSEYCLSKLSCNNKVKIFLLNKLNDKFKITAKLGSDSDNILKKVVVKNPYNREKIFNDYDQKVYNLYVGLSKINFSSYRSNIFRLKKIYWCLYGRYVNDCFTFIEKPKAHSLFEDSMCGCYIIYSRKSLYYYIGYSTDIKKRLITHYKNIIFSNNGELWDFYINSCIENKVKIYIDMGPICLYQNYFKAFIQENPDYKLTVGEYFILTFHTELVGKILQQSLISYYNPLLNHSKYINIERIIWNDKYLNIPYSPLIPFETG